MKIYVNKSILKNILCKYQYMHVISQKKYVIIYKLNFSTPGQPIKKR